MCYVGQAYIFDNRWKNHRLALKYNKHHSRYLQSAWNKYGEDNFEFEVLEKCSIERLVELEQFWMDHFKSADREFGYNLAPAAGSLLGIKHSDETKAKLSELRKGIPRTEEVKANMREGWKKRGPVSEATKEKMRQAQLGKKQSEASKAKKSLALMGNKNNKGGPMSEEHKAAISAARIGHAVTEETRNRISNGNLGKFVSEETRAKQSEAAKRRWSKNAIDNSV